MATGPVARTMLPFATSIPSVFKSAGSPSRTCTRATRHFTSSFGGRLSTRRKLVTSTAYRPQTFDTSPPPPRNTNASETSVGSVVPIIHDIRPPQIPLDEAVTSPINPLPPVVSSKEEVHKSKPADSSLRDDFTTPVRPKRSKLRPRKAAMTLTPAATAHLKILLEQPDPKLIRVGVKNRGCSGLAYHLEYVDKPEMFDEAVEQDGVKVLVDSKALFSIIGSEMDWAEDKLNQRFVFRNPNIKEQCGCGESFMV